MKPAGGEETPAVPAAPPPGAPPWECSGAHTRQVWRFCWISSMNRATGSSPAADPHPGQMRHGNHPVHVQRIRITPTPFEIEGIAQQQVKNSTESILKNIDPLRPASRPACGRQSSLRPLPVTRRRKPLPSIRSTRNSRGSGRGGVAVSAGPDEDAGRHDRRSRHKAAAGEVAPAVRGARPGDNPFDQAEIRPGTAAPERRFRTCAVFCDGP